MTLHVTSDTVPFSPEVMVNNTNYRLQSGQNVTIDHLPAGYLSLKANPVTVGDKMYLTKFSPAVVDITPGKVAQIYITFDVLASPEDIDLDGIPNTLEINGYVWNPVTLAFEAYDPNNPVHQGLEVYRTNPLSKSTSGDPYSDSRKASKRDLSYLRPPYDHPWVAASPLIKARTLEYAVIPIAEISDAQGNSIATSFSQSVTTSDSQTHGANFSVSQEIGWSLVRPDINTSITSGYSGSRTWGTESTNETGSEEGISWETAVTVNTAEAADVTFTVVLRNEGSLYASNIHSTFNILLAGKVIATVSGISIAALGPGEQSAPFIVGDGTTLSLDDLKALQLGAPLTIEMTQVESDIREQNPFTGNWEVIGEWPDLFYDIDPKTVTFFYTEKDGTKTEYNVAARPTAGTDYIQITLGDLFNVVLGDKIQVTNDSVYINGILWDNTWTLYVKELDRLLSFLETPNPVLSEFPVYVDDIIELREPVASEVPTLIYTEFLPNYQKVKASVTPGIYGITKIEAEVLINGQIEKFPLTANPVGSQFYETAAFPTSADLNFLSRLFVTDGKPNADGTTGVLYTYDIAAPSDKEGYGYETVSSPQVIIDATSTALFPGGTTNQLKNPGPVNIDLNNLGVKGKTYVFQVESHRWSSSDISVTIGDQTVQLACDDVRPNQIEFKYEFKDNRPPVYQLYEGCRMYGYYEMLPEIPGDQIQKVTQINSNVNYNGTTMELYAHPYYNHNQSGDSPMNYSWGGPNGNLIFDSNQTAIQSGVSSFRVMGSTPQKVYDPNVKVRFYKSDNAANFFDVDVNGYTEEDDLDDTHSDYEDYTKAVELFGDHPVMLQLYTNKDFTEKGNFRHVYLDPYYNVGKHDLWTEFRIDTNHDPSGLSSYKIWPVEDYPYLQRGAKSSPIVSRTVMVTVPDNATTLPISWNIGGSGNADYARVQYKNVAGPGETERWRTVQTDAHIKVSLIGAFTANEAAGNKFTSLATQNIRNSLKIPTGQTSSNASIALPTEGINANAAGYLVRVQSVNISGDEVKVNVGNQLCYLGSSDYNMNIDRAAGSPGPSGTIAFPVRDEVLFVPVATGATTLNISATISNVSRLSSSGGTIHVDIIGYFSENSKLKFIPFGFVSTGRQTNEFTVNALPYHKIAAHLMNITIEGAPQTDYRNLLKINGGSTPYIHDLYVGLTDGISLRSSIKYDDIGRHSVLAYGVANNNPVNKVKIDSTPLNQYITANYIGYFH